MTVAWAIGAGAGLAALAGFRVFIPVAVFMFMARLGWVWGFTLAGTAFDFMYSNAAVMVLLVLAVLEVLLTRASALTGIERRLRLPLAVAGGALLLAAASAGEAAENSFYLAGLPAGALLSWLGVYIHRGLMAVGEGRDPGPALDVSVLMASVAMMLAPPAGYLLLVFALWLAWRLRKLKRAKYKGLRVLA